MAGTYKWEILGLLKTEDIVIYSYEYPFDISAIGINFRLFTTRDANTLTVKVNKQKAYELFFNTGSTRSN